MRLLLLCLRFNPRVLAGGRDKNNTMLHKRLRVSIHASSREDATSYDPERKVFIMFQSTRPRGRTRLPLSSGRREPTSFNPRVLAGGRDRRDCFTVAETMFQSTRPRGRTRLRNNFYPIFNLLFQSTRPRGRTRRRIVMMLFKAASFNPRVLAGGRDSAGIKSH